MAKKEVEKDVENYPLTLMMITEDDPLTPMMSFEDDPLTLMMISNQDCSSDGI